MSHHSETTEQSMNEALLDDTAKKDERAVAVAADVYSDDATPTSSPKTAVKLNAEGAQQREVKDFQDIDIQSFSVIEGLRPMKEGYEFTIEGVLNVWVLFNAVTTTMILLNTFKATIPGQDRKAFGSRDGFDGLFLGLTYFPLVFFTLLVMLVNNNYAERSYYEYLERGVIIDFPESAQPKYMARRPRVILYALAFVVYLIFAAVVLIKYAAAFGTIAIVLNNLAVGVGLMWYKAQAIEDKFVSLTTFIQSFPDANGEYDNIDTVSLTTAANFLMSLALAESEDPAYTGLMRRRHWERHNVTGLGKVLRHISTTGAIAIVCALCVVYFIFMDEHVEEARFGSQANPCIKACIAASNRTQHMCSFCIDQCADLFHLLEVSKACQKQLSVPGCSTAACP